MKTTYQIRPDTFALSEESWKERVTPGQILAYFRSTNKRVPDTVDELVSALEMPEMIAKATLQRIQAWNGEGPEYRMPEVRVVQIWDAQHNPVGYLAVLMGYNSWGTWTKLCGALREYEHYSHLEDFPKTPGEAMRAWESGRTCEPFGWDTVPAPTRYWAKILELFKETVNE